MLGECFGLPDCLILMPLFQKNQRGQLNPGELEPATQCDVFAGCVCHTLRCAAVMKPRWPLEVLNRGDPTRTSGWFDLRCQGAKNDYCRWVGSGEGAYFSCALAGYELPETPPGQVCSGTFVAVPIPD